MASTENESQPEALQDEQPVDDVEQEVEEVEETSDVSKVSVISNSFEPKLSTIVEENDTPVVELATPTVRPQEEWYEKLARPKVLHLQETLDLFEKCKKDEMNERIMKIKLRLGELRGPQRHCSRQLQTEESIKLTGKSETIYNNLQRSLRKVAFETLAKQIFDKMPELIVQMRHNLGQQSTPEMTALFDTLQATLNYYLGQPKNEYEDRIFNHLCYGLAKFIESIIENVHTTQQDSERVAKKGKTSDGQYPVAVQLARKAFKERQ